MICTYPRSGSHLLLKIIEENFSKSIPKNHWKVYGKDFYIISIIRDPRESVCSLVSMRPRIDNLEEQIKEAIDRYVLFYNYILDRANLIFEFEDLMKDTEKIIKIIEKNINKEDFIEYEERQFSQSLPTRDFGRLETSKNKDKYKLVNDAIDKHDLKEAYEIYNYIRNRINDTK